MGEGIDEANRMGPLAHARRLPAVQGIIDESLQHGARLLAGGKRIARKGCFFEPTVLADVPNSARDHERRALRTHRHPQSIP